MDWITTNIRFPEDLYMELKLEAAKTRKSISEIIRERVSGKKKSPVKADIKKFMKKMDKLAAENARQNPGISFSEGLIRMRYEQ